MSTYLGKYTLSSHFNVYADKYLETTKTKLKNAILKGINAKLNKWEALVVTALSKNISSVSGEVKANSRRATKDRFRAFPYMRTGALRSSVNVRATVSTATKSSKISFALKAVVGRSPSIETGKPFRDRAVRTNEGQGSKDVAGWVGWMDDITTGDGRGIVKDSVREIFNDFTRLRRENLF